MTVLQGHLSEGISGVAAYMGLDPSNAYFMHSTVVDPGDNKVGEARRQLREFGYRYAQTLGYMSRPASGAAAKAFVLPLPSSMTHYFAGCGLIDADDLIVVGEKPTSSSYPAASVAAQLKAAVSTDGQLRQSLAGKTLISSAISNDELEIAATTGCHLVMAPELQAQCNSKVFLRAHAEQSGYLVPIGIEITELDQLESQWNTLLAQLEDAEFDKHTVKLWIKLEAQSSGEGTFVVDGVDDASLEKVRTTVTNYSDVLGSFPSFVIEVDVGSYPSATVVANVGVQAVLSEQAAVIVGSTLQRTRDGRYVGCEIDDELRMHAPAAERATEPALEFLRNAGYRGFINIDVIVANSPQGMKGYLIDPNARFSGGTPLLSITQRTEVTLGVPQFGLMYSNFAPVTEDSFQTLIGLCEDSLYEGESSAYQGIIPFFASDMSSRADETGVATVIVTGESMSYVRSVYDAYKARLDNELSRLRRA